MGQRTDGDLLFEAYLIERGFDRPEHEPDLGINVRPEYLLSRDGEQCLTEVKEFALSSWPIRHGINSQAEVLKPIRRQIHEAARKLRQAESLGYPLVAVLTDPANALFGLLSPREIIAAIRGDMAVSMPIHPGGGQAGEAVLIHCRNGELRNDHPYLTAVAVVHRLLDKTHRADVYVTHSPGARSLSDVFFAGPDDVFYDYAADLDSYVERADTA